uniref:Expressed protein n=1 Tax=Echinococcus granulosus TaxID=6210 RepID=A0A068WLR2_ECHGR|nr:expressed protein [Echinococcus granulosus]
MLPLLLVGLVFRLCPFPHSFCPLSSCLSPKSKRFLLIVYLKYLCLVLLNPLFSHVSSYPISY